MPKSRKVGLEQSVRREKVAELALQGKTLREISEILGVSKSCAHRDLDILEGEWKTAALRDFDAAKAEQVARVQELFKVYWQAWHDSRQAFKSEDRKTARAAGKGGAGGERMEIKVSTKTRNGDPRYLTGVQWCIDKLCKLLGLNAPVQVDLGAGVLVISGASAEKALGQVLGVPVVQGGLELPEQLSASAEANEEDN